MMIRIVIGDLPQALTNMDKEAIDAERLDQQGVFIRFKIYTGTEWMRVNFPDYILLMNGLGKR